MDWERDLPTWPLHAYSRRIMCKPHCWHVQIMGQGEDLLLLHGAGGATQSWRRLMPILAEHYRVIALDLPGQGFTRLGARRRCGIEQMRDDIMLLCEQEGWRPKSIIGHSAGAALGLTLVPGLGPGSVVCINAALGRFEGIAGLLFPALARLVAATPFFADTFAATSGSPAQVTRLLKSTGSKFDQTTVELYARLASNKQHVDGTLRMMAQWDITPAENLLPVLEVPVLFLIGGADGTVPPAVSERAASRMKYANIETYDGMGHLLHEERAQDVAQSVLNFLEYVDGSAQQRRSKS